MMRHFLLDHMIGGTNPALPWEPTSVHFNFQEDSWSLPECLEAQSIKICVILFPSVYLEETRTIIMIIKCWEVIISILEFVHSELSKPFSWFWSYFWSIFKLFSSWMCGGVIPCLWPKEDKCCDKIVKNLRNLYTNWNNL